MSALLRAELLRVRSRAVVWGTAVVMVVAALGFVVAAWDDTRPPSAEQVAEAHEELVHAVELWERDRPVWREACEEALSADPPGPDIAVWEESCDERLDAPPTLDDVLVRPTLADTLERRYAPMGAVVVVALLVMGVALVTGDFASGAMGTWLTFAPRRGRVLVSRLVAALAAAVPVALVAMGATLVGILAVIALNGVPGGTGGAAGVVATATARALAAGLWATALGVGLAFALRVGAGVAGLVVWWLAAVESALPLLVPVTRGFTVTTSLRAWFEGSVTYTTDECVAVPGQTAECTPVEHLVGWAQGGGLLLGVALVALGLGALSFRLRDVP